VKGIALHSEKRFWLLFARQKVTEDWGETPKIKNPGIAPGIILFKFVCAKAFYSFVAFV
jgi:hypothetical protein